MGGVAGHMDHLYDDRDLTFAGMKQILSAASEGKLSYEEKVDGQNIFLSYDLSANPPRAVAARNMGNIKKGGMDATALANMFAGRGGLTEAFKGLYILFLSLSSAILSLILLTHDCFCAILFSYERPANPPAAAHQGLHPD